MNEYTIRFCAKVWNGSRLIPHRDDYTVTAYGETPVRAWMSVVTTEAMRDRMAYKALEITETRSNVEPSDIIGEVRNAATS